MNRMQPIEVVFNTYKEYRKRGWIACQGGGISVLDVKQQFNFIPSEIVCEWPNIGDVGQLAKSSVNRNVNDVCAGVFPLPPDMAHVKAVVHTHSVKAIKYTRRDAAVQALMTLNISRLTKGIWNRANCREYEEGEICTIPIIQNGTDHELIDRIHDALKSNPSSCSVLVRDHGLFVFADTWRKAKKECEIIEQQFELEV